MVVKNRLQTIKAKDIFYTWADVALVVVVMVLYFCGVGIASDPMIVAARIISARRGRDEGNGGEWYTDSGVNATWLPSLQQRIEL